MQTVMILYLRYRCVYVWIKREGTREAFEFHKKARVLKPLHQAVIGNEKYFWDVWGME